MERPTTLSDIETLPQAHKRKSRRSLGVKLRVLHFLLIEKGLVRDPAILFAITGSLARAGLIFAINETARNAGQFGWSVVLLAGAALIFLVSTYFARVRAHVVINRIQREMRAKMSQGLLAADVNFLLRRDHGQVYSVITREITEVSVAAVSVLESIESILLLSLCIPYLFWVSWLTAAVTLSAILIGLMGYVIFDLPARRLVVHANNAAAIFCDRVDDMLSGWMELRLRSSRRRALQGDTYQAIDEISDYSVRAERYFSASLVLAQSALIALLCFIVVLLPLLQGAGPTEMFQVLTVVLLTYGPIELIFATLPRLSRSDAAYAKVKDVEQALTAARTERNVAAEGKAPQSFRKIELRGVVASVGEGGRPGAREAEAFALGPVDLTLVPGEVLFICGGNGAGKSTLLALIAGLRHPDKGQLVLDGTQVTADNVAAYRELFSAVFSGFHLFDRTFGLDAGEVAKLNAEITKLGLADRVQVLEGRFSNLSLSSGQKRRLALAVARAESRPIIILDEFAADQDPANRAFYYDELIPQMARDGHLVIAVTHDDHQFDKCDRLVKMDAGRIVSDTRHPRPQAAGLATQGTEPR